MITQINRTVPTFKVDTHTIDAETKEYKDPLMRWPLRGCAFTSEVGESLRPLVGTCSNTKLGTGTIIYWCRCL